MTLLLYLLMAALLLVALAFAQPLYRRGRWYAYRDTISAQAQACGVSAQVGSLLVGWAPHSWFNGRRSDYKPTRLIIWAPVHGGGSRVVFQLLILRRGVSFATRQEGSGYSWPGAGLRLV